MRLPKVNLLLRADRTDQEATDQAACELTKVCEHKASVYVLCSRESRDSQKRLSKVKLRRDHFGGYKLVFVFLFYFYCLIYLWPIN